MSEILFLPQEHKICIFELLCDVLFIIIDKNIHDDNKFTFNVLIVSKTVAFKFKLSIYK
jgi:hypothetical protein